MPLIVAHRGASGLYPENTILSMQQAHRQGADLIEIDVRLTQDGFVVVLHDATVNRTTNGSGCINKMTLAEARSFDAGYRFTPDNGRSHPFIGSGLHIPLLSEVLEALPSARFQIELKEDNFVLAEAVLHVIRQHNALTRTQIATAYGRLLRFISNKEPEAVLAHSALDAARIVLCAVLRRDYCPRLHSGFLDLPFGVLRHPVLLARIKDLASKHSLKLCAYIVNDLDHMRQLISMGVEGFITDYPAEAKQLVNTLTGIAPKSP